MIKFLKYKKMAYIKQKINTFYFFKLIFFVFNDRVKLDLNAIKTAQHD